MDKFKNKYRIPSNRLRNWDYGSNGAYFITICTRDREHFFGEIVKNATKGIFEMQLNEIGQLAEKYWLEIPNKFPFVELGNFVVMPNHTHGILIINKTGVNVDHAADGTDGGAGGGFDNEFNDGAEGTNGPDDHLAQLALLNSAQPPSEIIGGFAGIFNPMFHENISRMIRWYKGRCTFEMRKIHADFAWQSNYHDHIIRDSKSFEIIQTYIENNPKNWPDDRFYAS
jgi:putative transposase